MAEASCGAKPAVGLEQAELLKLTQRVTEASHVTVAEASMQVQNIAAAELRLAELQRLRLAGC